MLTILEQRYSLVAVVCLSAFLICMASPEGETAQSENLRSVPEKDGTSRTWKTRREAIAWFKETNSHEKEGLTEAIKKDPFKIINRFVAPVRHLVLEASQKWVNLTPRWRTTKRLEDIVGRALIGQDIGMAILGGSNSAGGGLLQDEKSIDGLYFRTFLNWWKETVEPYTNSTINELKLSIGGTSSDFYACCYQTFLAPNEHIDLAFLEFAINDYLSFKSTPFPTSLPFEQLTRKILSRTDPPAVMNVNLVQAEAGLPLCEQTLETNGQTELAVHYGITTVSMRNETCSETSTMSDWQRLFSTDGRHVSPLVHAEIGLSIINEVRGIFLRVLDATKKGYATVSDMRTVTTAFPDDLDGRPLDQYPPPLFVEKQRTLLHNSYCYTFMTPDVSRRKFFPSLVVKEIAGTCGFQLVLNQPIGINTIDPQVRKLRTDACGGWLANKPDSLLRLELWIPMERYCANLGQNDPSFTTSSVLIAIRTDGNGGEAVAWLDSAPNARVHINTRSPLGHTKLHTITTHVLGGRHALNIKTISAGTVTVVAVIVVPSDAEFTAPNLV